MRHRAKYAAEASPSCCGTHSVLTGPSGTLRAGSKGLAAARSHQGADVLFRNSDLAKHLLLARAARGRFHRPAPGVHDLQVVTARCSKTSRWGCFKAIAHTSLSRNFCKNRVYTTALGTTSTLPAFTCVFGAGASRPGVQARVKLTCRKAKAPPADPGHRSVPGPVYNTASKSACALPLPR